MLSEEGNWEEEGGEMMITDSQGEKENHQYIEKNKIGK